MGSEVTVHGRVNGREKMLFAEAREKPKALQLVLDRIFQFGKAQLDTRRSQCVVKFGQGVGRSDIDAGHRLRRDDQPAHRRRRRRHRVEDPLLEQLGVGEKQGRIPAEQDQAGDRDGHPDSA